MTVALAADGRPRGRVYAVDIDPARRDQVAQAAAEAGEAQVVAITQAAEELVLPELVDLAYCRFLLMHVVDPLAVLGRMASVTRPGGWLLAPGAHHLGRAGRRPCACRCPAPATPTWEPFCPALVRDAGLELVDAWAEAPAGPVPARGGLPGGPHRASAPATTPSSCPRSSRCSPASLPRAAPGPGR